MSMWFLGIIFRKLESAESTKIDLTYDIQSFTDAGKPVFYFALVLFLFFFFLKLHPGVKCFPL